MPSFIIKCTKFNQSRSKKKAKINNVTNKRKHEKYLQVYCAGNFKQNARVEIKMLTSGECKHGKGIVALQP